MDPAHALQGLGGAATCSELLALTSRGRLRHAVAAGTIHRASRGRYVLPDVSPDRRIAASLGGVLSHASAAAHHRWPTVSGGDRVHVTLPPGRRRRPTAAGVVLHWSPLSDEELASGVTDPVRTVLDCAALPLPDALAVADSALRGGLERRELLDAARASPSRGRPRRLVVARAADARSANPFESALRGVLLDAGIVGWVPQHVVTGPGFFAVVDLALPERRLALEADGYGVHGNPRAFSRDLRRHDDLVAFGWRTLRFTWRHVTAEPSWIVTVVRQVLAQQPLRR